MTSYGVQLLYSRADIFILQSAATAGIVLGVVTTLVSFLGCCGATNEKGVLLKTYFGMLLVLIVLQIVAGSIAASQQDNVRSIFFFDAVLDGYVTHGKYYTVYEY